MRTRKRTYKPGERYQVKAYVPPDYISRAAEDRTQGMLHYYLDVSRGMPLEVSLDMLGTLVRSAYMQGANDVIEAGIRNGLYKEPQ